MDPTIWLTETGFEPTSTTFNHLAKLAKWLSVCVRSEWLWVWIPLLSLKLQIWRLLWVKSFLTFSQTIECWFTLKLVRDMIITHSLQYRYFHVGVNNLLHKTSLFIYWNFFIYVRNTNFFPFVYWWFPLIGDR